MSPRRSLPLAVGFFGMAAVLLLSTYHDTRLLLLTQMKQHQSDGTEQGALVSNNGPSSSSSSSPPHPIASAPAAATTNNRTLHMLYGLAGGDPSFMDEFEVSLKSLLLNAPLDADLDVHFIVDREAHVAVLRRLRDAEVEGSLWRTRTSLLFYEVSNATKRHMEERFERSLPLGPMAMDQHLGVGTIFRLYAHEILPKSAGPALVYTDNDVVFLNNLNALEPHLDQFVASDYLFQAGNGWDVCAGFVFLNLPRFHEFFPLLKSLRNESFPHFFDSLNDQFVMLQVKKSHPDLVGDMPKEWYVHLAHGFRRNVHLLKVHRSNIAMLHFNGLRPRGERWYDGGLWRYCDESESCKTNETIQRHYRETWNLAEYYVYLPWEMAKHQGAAIAGNRGHPLQIRHVTTIDL